MAISSLLPTYCKETMKKHDGYIEVRSYFAALTVCVLIIIGLVIILFATPDTGVSAEREAKAIAALQDAEYRVHNTTQYGGPLEFDEECDSIWDDINDALAYLGEP